MTKTTDASAAEVLAVLEFHANGLGNADNRGMKLSAKACGNIAAELRQTRTAVVALIAERDALREDAERWRHYSTTSDSSLTLRLHYSRADLRNSVIDAARAEAGHG